jgi:uncharacterized protein YjbI with pentapeptide repeats
MEKSYIVDQVFDKSDFKMVGLAKAVYENCTFTNCDLSNIDLTDFNFTDCEFKGCNMSLAKVVKTVFNQVTFTNCKLLGLLFENSSEFLFSVSFDHCVLNHSSFFKQKLKKTIFKNSSLHEVDFSECDLSHAVFEHCDLKMATFENTILNKADLRTAINYTINPETNNIKKALFSLQGLPGLLHKYDIEIV